MVDARRLRPLVEAFLWPLLLSETCDESTLDPDIAVKQMENVASASNDLASIERAVVLQVLEDIARNDHRPELSKLIRDVPRSLGWLDGV